MEASFSVEAVLKDEEGALWMAVVSFQLLKA
jgi:hypothetical protein